MSLREMGLSLKAFANGWDDSGIVFENTSTPIKSVGNSTTTPSVLENEEETKIILYALSESVATGLRENGFTRQLTAIVMIVSFILVTQKRTPVQ